MPGEYQQMLNAPKGVDGAISKVAFDLGVSENNIKCVNQWTGKGQAIYMFQVGDNADKIYRYEQIGTTYRKVEYQPPYIDGISEEGVTSNHPVISRVAFDLSIPQSEIKMVRKREGAGNGDYILKVNDKYVKYKKIGSAYLPENQPAIM